MPFCCLWCLDNQQLDLSSRIIILIIKMDEMEQQSEYKFVVDTQVNAKRIPDEVWDGFKKIILDLYEVKRLEDVMQYMETYHGFRAT